MGTFENEIWGNNTLPFLCNLQKACINNAVNHQERRALNPWENSSYPMMPTLCLLNQDLEAHRAKNSQLILGHQRLSIIIIANPTGFYFNVTQAKEYKRACCVPECVK